jgi:hypothetical protein
LLSPGRPIDAIRLKTRLMGLAVAATIGLGLAGCVERRMLIRTNPPGAMAYVDDYPVGLTPTATSFTYYGTRRIRLVKDGYETETFLQPVSPPWYQIPPLDFFAENLVPGSIRDYHAFDYQLKPQVLVPAEQVLDRAEQLRRQTHASAGTQPSALVPLGAPVSPGALVPPGPLVPPGAPGAYPPQGSQQPPPLSPPGAAGPPVQPGPGAVPAPSVGPLPYPVEPPGGWQPRSP